jgi:predicted metal-dependent peptidase
MSDTTLREQEAREYVLKARTELIVTRTFYGVLLGQVTPVISHKVPTAATNGKQHYWNPDYIAKLSKNHLGIEVPRAKLVLGVQAHESEHDSRRHHTRRGGRDALEWNICCDYSINVDLIDEGFELPEGALIDRKYKGMSAEDIYRSREIDRALKKQQEEEERQKQQQQDEQDEQDEQDDADVDGNEADDEQDESGDEESDNDVSDSDEQDSDESSDSDADASESSDDDADASDESGDNAQDGDDESGNDAGNSDGEPDGTSEQEPSGEAADASEQEGAGDTPASAGNGSGEAAGEAGEAGSEPSSAGDPGGCGEVLDAADDTATLASEDAHWETVLRQAAMLAAKRGTAPGHVARELEHADHPPQDWRETLRAFYDAGATVRETWSRPNRRLIGSGLYLPGREREGINRAVFLIDTSGSVTYYPGALEAIKAETQAALDEGFIDELMVVYGDTQVNRVDTYRNGDEIEFDPRGGGGTVMKPMFDFARDEVDASCIVCFTDLEIEPESMLGDEPACPVLWAAVGYPDRVKRYLENTPWGAPGIEVVPSYN